MRATPSVQVCNDGPVATVFVVDDDSFNCETLKGQLQPAGYTVETFTDPEGAITRMQEHPPDVLLLDYMMPSLDGVEVIDILKSDERTRPIQILMVTALSDRDSTVAALQAGASDYLIKPVVGRELRARVATHVQVAEYQRSLQDARRAAERELDSMKEQLLKLDRLASLGTFAAGVGHEIKNIATVLTSYTDLIHLAVSAQQLPRLKDVEALQEACRHITEHGQAILDFGASRDAQLDTFEVVDVTRHVVDMLKVAGRTRRGKVVVEAPDGPLQIRYPRTAVEQVLINLVGNADDALEGATDGKVTVRVSGRPKGIALTVEDNGCGMTPEVLAKASQPFFTTKPPGQGSGLGLSVVKRIVTDSGGEFSVHSRPGEGTQVSVVLPSEARVAAAPA